MVQVVKDEMAKIEKAPTSDAQTSPLKALKKQDDVQDVPEPQQPPNQPEYPTFEDQMKNIREGYAKDYQEKITRGFQEIDELKKDIASKQEIHDTKQVRELRREMKRLEDEILSQRNEK